MLKSVLFVAIISVIFGLLFYNHPDTQPAVKPYVEQFEAFVHKHLKEVIAKDQKSANVPTSKTVPEQLEAPAAVLSPATESVSTPPTPPTPKPDPKSEPALPSASTTPTATPTIPPATPPPVPTASTPTSTATSTPNGDTKSASQTVSSKPDTQPSTVHQASPPNAEPVASEPAQSPPNKLEKPVVSRVLKGLQTVVGTSKPACSRVALGYNSNLDLIVRALPVVNSALNGQSASAVAVADHDIIRNVPDFLETFLYYFEKGSAAERFVEDGVLFDSIVDVAQTVPSFHWHIGGNAALMATRFANEGCTNVLLGGAVGETLKSLLPSSITLASTLTIEEQIPLETRRKLAETQSDTTVQEPATHGPQNDEIHLILEYEKGSQLGTYTAPRANRFIMHSDRTNSELQQLPPFHLAVEQYNTSLLVLSGLHLLDGQPDSLRLELIKKISSFLTVKRTGRAYQGLDFPVHLELASMADVNFMREIISKVAPAVDSLGLNEQELFTVYRAMEGNQYTQQDFKDPHIRTVVEAIKHIITSIQGYRRVNGFTPSMRLSRIHFHCLQFHLIAVLPQSKHANIHTRVWSDAARAVAAGSLTATYQACAGNDKDVSNHTVLSEARAQNLADVTVSMTVEGNDGDIPARTINPDSPVLDWTEDDVHFYTAPVLVCKKPGKTVGLGDSISAVGLIYSL